MSVPDQTDAAHATPPAVADGALDIEALYRNHRGRALQLARAYLHDEEDARDAVQEAFVKAKRASDTFTGQAQAHTWLCRIVVNVCLDMRRRRRRRPELSVDDVESVAWCASTEESPAAALERRELSKTLEEGLSRLSPHHRSTMLLRELSGLEYREIAAIEGCPPGTIMSRLFHARRRMRRWITRRDRSFRSLAA